MKIISLDKGCIAFIFGLLLWCTNMRANYIPPIGASRVWQSAVSGTVSDKDGPLPGVTVYVKGSSKSVISDQTGRYTIAAALGDTIVFFFMGFKEREAVVNSLSIDIVLIEDTAELQEVVINAGYYTVKDKERTGSIARITAKDIEKQPVTNVLATMQGRMAGVNVTQDSGTPGGGFTIRIRGVNSLRPEGNEPLYIIDGVPYSSESTGFELTSTPTFGTSSPLNSINPADIESIEVLKDADATAIYGSRGSNGVVLITTKKGKTGKTAVNFNISTGVGTVTRMLDLMDTTQYLAMRRQAYANDGITAYPDNAYDVNGTWDQDRYTDWQEELTGGTAEIQNVQAGVSGGSESTQYLLSTSYRTETTVMPGNFRYNKGAVHFNMNHLSADQRFKLIFTAGYTAQNNRQPSTDLTRISRILAPNAPALYDSQGNLNWENATWENPLAMLRQEFNSRTHDLVANALLSYKLADGLSARTNFGYTELRNEEERTLPSTIYNPIYNVGSAYSSLYLNTTARESWIIEPQLNYTKEFGDHTIEALVGATAQHLQTSKLHQYGYGFSSNSLIHDLSSASLKFIFASDTDYYRYQAFYARLNYNCGGKYILNLTGRRDGSSRFGPGRQFANFGAIGGAWIFSKENWLAESKFLSFGKLRGSYGIAGSDQIGDYQYLDTYSSSGQPYQGVIGLQPDRLYNPDFSWETNKKLEFAIEAGFFNDRLLFTGAWYRNRSSNQLVGIPMPGTTGFASLNANLEATVQNTGLELTVSTENIRKENFNWTTSFNISITRNKLIAFPRLETSTYANTYEIGRPLAIRKVFHYTGINPDTGIYEFEDRDGDGAITYDGDRTAIADLSPKFFGGLQNQVTYKGLTLDFLFQFVKQDTYKYLASPGGFAINQPTGLSSSWQQPGDNTSNQQLTTGANSEVVNAFSNYTDSDGAITDGSYIRLKNISLTYDVPLQLDGIKCRLLFSGQNLLTFTPYEGGDPEFRVTGYLPPLKIYTAGVQLNF
jgi:TonB-linked SusC/RagA family outer membrane protein